MYKSCNLARLLGLEPDWGFLLDALDKNSSATSSGAVTIHRGQELWDVRARAVSAGVLADRFTFVTIANPGLVVDNDSGRILACGEFPLVKREYPDAAVVDHGEAVLIPGFVDCHLHFPQLHAMGSYGNHLIQWLETYIFPTEARFSDRTVAELTAASLCRELAANGVATSVIFSSVHPVAADALFQSLDRSGLRAVVGKTSMDVNAPDGVLLEWQYDIAAQEELIARWHGHDGRLFYAVTPRFILTSSQQQMAALGALHARYPDVYIQTHISECRDEIAAVKSAFPESADYLSLYEDHGLVNDRTLLGHGIWLSDSERERIAKCGASVVHCPTSNNFLGSGMLDVRKTCAAGVQVALGSDIGAGTSLSPWATMLDAYKVQALLGQPLDPASLFYLATLAGAEALHLDHVTGSLEPGKDADFQVVRPGRRPVLAERLGCAASPVERLFATIVHGDDRILDSLFVRGRRVSESFGK